jgi:ATP-dependent exoDNAse (exonuclease V) beta subunit
VKVFDKDTQTYRKPTFRDFSILLRRKTHLKHYINAFKAHGIPFYVADTGSLMESLSVKSLLFALNTLEFQDNINLYGTLSLLLKVSDDSLTDFVFTGRELISGLTEDTNYTGVSESLVEAFQLIRRWCKIRDRATLRELAGRVIEETGLLSSCAQRDLLETENLFRFLDLCRDYDEQGYTLKEFLEELSDFGQEQQEAIDVSEEEDVVRFITIHSSKGLEFPIVILADSGQSIAGVSSEVLFEPETGLALKKDKDKWEMLKKVLEQKEIEEAKRLLYVALTRARDYLLISGEMKSDKKDSFLKWLDQEAAVDGQISVEIIKEPANVVINDVKIPDSKSEKPRHEKKQVLPEQIPISRNYSVTSLGEFLRCPRRYYLSNLMGIPERMFYKSDGDLSGLSAMERGTIVHELIEKIHSDNIKVETPEELLAALKHPLTFDDRKHIKRCLHNYLGSELYNASGVVCSEVPFTYHLERRRYITGKIDHLVFEEDGVTIVDFKTNTIIDPSLLQTYRLQVMAYAIAVSEIYDVKPKKAIIASLFEGKVTEVDTIPSSLAECRTQICSIVNTIETGEFKENTMEKPTCEFCAYKDKLCGNYKREGGLQSK